MLANSHAQLHLTESFMSDLYAVTQLSRKLAALCVGVGIAFASSASCFAGDVKLANGATWKGDVGAQVRATVSLAGKDVTLEGKLLEIKKNLIVLEVQEGGKVVRKTVLCLDLKKLETLAAAAKAGAPAGAPATASAPGKAPAAGVASADKKKPTLFILPWEGMVGTGARHEQIAEIGKEADKLGPGQIIVIHVDSPGGLVIEGDQIHATLVDLKSRHKVIAWIKKAISAGAYTSLHCDEIYFERVGNLGAITMFAGTVAASGDELDAWLIAVGDACEIGGRFAGIGHAMVTKAPLLSYDRDDDGNVVWHATLEGKYKLSDAEQNLSINAETAIHSKFSQGLADTRDELLVLLNYDKNDIIISEAGYQIHDKWQALLKQCVEEKKQALRDLENPGGSDEEAQLGQRIKALRTIIRWFDKCMPGMAYEAPQLGDSPKRFEEELERMKKRMGEIQKEKDRNAN